MDDVALAHENLLGLLADLPEKGLAEKPLLEELGDAGVDVEDAHVWGNKRRVEK